MNQPSLSTSPAAPEAVVLLHGLARTARSMEKLANLLRLQGYVVVNLNYPSRHHTITELSEMAIPPALASAPLRDIVCVHFVTHSMGGILLRDYARRHGSARIGRAVMLGPPNRGSELVDALGDWWLFKQINGPAGQQLGTAAESLPNRLGAVDFPVGVIAGCWTINWINSLAIIPGADDGKVSVERSRVAGMADHLVMRTTHPLMMRSPRVMRQTLHFLQQGQFDHVQ